ncbi:hypothetical protein V6N13_104318 [Hibiscus sabdariffa]
MAEQRDSITGRNSVEVIVNPSDVEDLHDMEVGKRMELIGIERHGVRVLVRKVSRRAMSRSMVLSSRFAALVDVEGVVHCDEGNVAGSNTKQSGASSLVSKSKGSSLNSVSKGGLERVAKENAKWGLKVRNPQKVYAPSRPALP